MGPLANVRGAGIYTIISVLFPGVAFLFGLIPLLPSSLTLDPLVAAGPLVALGFIAGQGIHSVAVPIQTFGRYPSHREIFTEYVQDAIKKTSSEAVDETSDVDDEGGETCLSPILDLLIWMWELIIGGPTPIEERNIQPLSSQFLKYYCSRCPVDFGFIEHNDEGEVCFSDQDPTDSELNSLYVLTRSQLQLSVAGRGRSMQAIYAFCRSIWVSSLLLTMIYFVYFIIRYPVSIPWVDSETTIPLFGLITGEFNLPTNDVDSAAMSHSNADIEFPVPLLESLPLGSSVYLVLTIGLPIVTYFIFQTATHQYKIYYIQYLFSDIINMRSASDREE